MALPWRLSTRADADLDRVLGFLSPKSPRASAAARDRIVDGLRLVSEQPRIGRRVHGATREIIVRFGDGAYVIRYRLTETEIFITRIWHSKEKRPR